MRDQLRIKGRVGQGMVAVLVLLTLTAGFCLFDDDSDKGTGFDLCAALATFSVAVTLPALGRLEPVLAGLPQAVHVMALLPLDPPPKSSLLSR